MATLIIGASPKPHRFAYKALLALQDKQQAVLLFAARGGSIEGLPVATSLADIDACDVDTITLYVNPERLKPMYQAIIELQPNRIIFNPGTESAAAKALFEPLGIACIEDCTLIMLREGHY